MFNKKLLNSIFVKDRQGKTWIIQHYERITRRAYPTILSYTKEDMYRLKDGREVKRLTDTLFEIIENGEIVYKI